ncbi:hypothetical protein BVX93_00900 [bacterium B13(2017)]|nr:hypothetical protein BVX93_00900 [bacterium B13(2017)]
MNYLFYNVLLAWIMHKDDCMKGLKRAFTLIELLVVICIIIILGSILTTGVNKVRKYTKNVQCVSNLKSLYMMSALYYHDYKEIPSKWSQLDLTYESENIKCPSAKNYNVKDQFYCLNGLIVSDDTLSKRFFDVNNYDLLFVDYMINLHNNCSNGIMSSGKMIQLKESNFAIDDDLSRVITKSKNKKNQFDGIHLKKVFGKDIDVMPVFFYIPQS